MLTFLLSLYLFWLTQLCILTTILILSFLYIVAGDFNIDLIDADKITVNKYNDILDAYGLAQHISYPTRHGKSLIDHISTNIPKKVICENVIPCETISDHDAPFVVLNIKKQKF